MSPEVKMFYFFSTSTFDFYYFRNLFIYCASVGAGSVAYQWWLEDNLLQPRCVSQESKSGWAAQRQVFLPLSHHLAS